MTQAPDPATPSATETAVVDAFPTHNLGKPQLKEMPAEPPQYWRLIGPGIIAAGVGLASGEFILFPYIASQVGLVFVWAALVGPGHPVLHQHGDRALHAGHRRDRADRVQPLLAALGPGLRDPDLLRQSVAGLGDQLGDLDLLHLRRQPKWIAIGMLIVIGLVLTLAPVVYVALERAQMLKVAAVLMLFVVGAIFAIGADGLGRRCRRW